MREEILKILEEETVYGTVLEASYEDVADKIVSIMKEKMGDSYVMDKNDKIEAIKKRIVELGGETSCAELEADASPCVSSINETSVLVEGFTENKVEVCTYVGSMEIASSFMKYEELSEEVLDDIINVLNA